MVKQSSNVKELSQQLDYYVGRKLKSRREKLGLNQADLGSMVGISYQQIQKYERGENKIPAGRLFQIATCLKVSTDYFYQGIKLHKSEDKKKKYLNIKRSRPLNILLVEDNPADEMLAIQALGNAKYKNNVFVLHDGMQVIEYLRQQGQYESATFPDIVILDLNIPKRSGIDVLKEIRRDSRISFIPVIILTNSINPQDFEKCYKHNVSGYVSKSFNIEEFNKKIDLIVSYWTTVAVLPSMQNIEEVDESEMSAVG